MTTGGYGLGLFSVTLLAAVVSATFYLRESDARAAAEAARADAEQQLARTRGLTDFLVEMIQSSNPERGGSSALTVKEVLEKAVGDVQGEISDDPAIEATIRCTIGVSMLVLGDQAAAEAQAARGLELVADAAGTDAWEECTLALGQALFYRFETDEARAMLEELLRVTRKPRFSNDVLTKAELNLAIMDSYAGRYEQTRVRMKALVDNPYEVLPEFDEYRLYGVHEYGVALAGLNRFEDAREALAESVRLRTAVFDARHPQTLFSKQFAMLDAERKPVDQPDAIVRPSIESAVKFIRHQLKDTDRQLRDEVDEHHRDLDALLRTVAGIGPVASAAIIAELPELGRLNHRELAALVGVAPFANDSGKKTGRRGIRGGRGTLRHTLYMATPTTVR